MIKQFVIFLSEMSSFTETDRMDPSHWISTPLWTFVYVVSTKFCFL